MEDPTFFNQSAFLYALYYQVQITVHRQWIPSPKKTSALSFASLAICTNAARSSIHILEVQHERYPHSSYHFIVRARDFLNFIPVLILLCRMFFYIKAPIILDWHRPDYQYLGRQALWDVDQSRQRDAGCVQVYANIEVSRTKVRVDLYRASQHPAYVIGRIFGLKVVRRGSHPVRSLSVLLQQNTGLTCVFTVVS